MAHATSSPKGSKAKSQAGDAGAANRGSRDPGFEGYLRQLKRRRLEAEQKPSGANSFGEAGFWARLDASISQAQREQNESPSGAQTSGAQPPIARTKVALRKVQTGWEQIGAKMDAAQKELASSTLQGTKTASKEPSPKPRPRKKDTGPPHRRPVHATVHPPSPTTPAANPPSRPAEAGPPQVPESSYPSNVEATVQELLKLAEVIEAAEETKEKTLELEQEELEVEEMEEVEEVEEGEEESRDDDETFSECSSGSGSPHAKDRQVWRPGRSLDELDFDDIPLLS
ncbi:unnamed protein product [Durusdinium trenchii]|uniref:Uncharacterized protein n=1 Tax=Durusdinium trenchii TaxID=1381693 RepID=A0ABP0NKZ7_9DINO